MAGVIIRPTLLPAQIVALELSEGEKPVSWIQVAKTGTFFSPRYGKFEITSTMLAEMIANFKATETKPPVDYDHLTSNPEKPGDGIAAGWFKDLELRADGKELWGQVEWTERAAEYIKNKEYQYVSPTFVSKYVSKEGGEPVGAKLLAAAITNRPFLDNMAPLALSEFEKSVIVLAEASDLSIDERMSRVSQALYDKYAAGPDPFSVYVVRFYDDHVIVRKDGKLFRLDYTIGADLKVTFASEYVEVIEQYTPVTSLSDVHGGNQMPEPTIVELTEKVNKLDTLVKDLSTNLASEKQLREAAEKTLNQERAERKVTDLIKSGKIAKAQEAWAKEYALKDAAGFDTFAATLTGTVVPLNKEHGSGEGVEPTTTTTAKPSDKTAVVEFSEKVEAYIKENGGKEKVLYKDAIRAVSLAEPELTERYREEMAVAL